MSKPLSFLSLLTGSFAFPAAENPTVAMVDPEDMGPATVMATNVTAIAIHNATTVRRGKPSRNGRVCQAPVTHHKGSVRSATTPAQLSGPLQTATA